MTYSIYRTDFSKQVGFTPVMFSGSSFSETAAKQIELKRKSAPKKIIVIGAGLAGVSGKT